MLIVKKILNKPIDSNCFIIHKKDSKSCIIIDPGTKNNVGILDYIIKKSLIPEYVILTHQHFDHIWGVNDLLEKYDNLRIVCNRNCSEMITDSKKNCSLFFDQMGFVLPAAHIITEDVDNNINWNNVAINFFNTPGHSTASICILIDKYLFSGDTLIKDTKTVVKLPFSSKHDLLDSISFLESLKGKNYYVCPGHGDCFSLDHYDLSLSIR